MQAKHIISPQKETAGAIPQAKHIMEPPPDPPKTKLQKDYELEQYEMTTPQQELEWEEKASRNISVG